jgi:hypothetical protein
MYARVATFEGDLEQARNPDHEELIQDLGHDPARANALQQRLALRLASSSSRESQSSIESSRLKRQRRRRQRTPRLKRRQLSWQYRAGLGHDSRRRRPPSGRRRSRSSRFLPRRAVSIGPAGETLAGLCWRKRADPRCRCSDTAG